MFQIFEAEAKSSASHYFLVNIAFSAAARLHYMIDYRRNISDPRRLHVSDYDI